ncbi:Hypothetical predicted protein [Octopus vulgaris]|uniref:Uncharacterized protein n=1 Tax=Octopus vulgaris TaxID=6645 RepID=A0AA36AY90_OCTVU|nr:Hypothetical predicted protein [Octopus vulgaris]
MTDSYTTAAIPIIMTSPTTSTHSSITFPTVRDKYTSRQPFLSIDSSLMQTELLSDDFMKFKTHKDILTKEIAITPIEDSSGLTKQTVSSYLIDVSSLSRFQSYASELLVHTTIETIQKSFAEEDFTKTLTYETFSKPIQGQSVADGILILSQRVDVFQSFDVIITAKSGLTSIPDPLLMNTTAKELLLSLFTNTSAPSEEIFVSVDSIGQFNESNLNYIITTSKLLPESSTRSLSFQQYIKGTTMILEMETERKMKFSRMEILSDFLLTSPTKIKKITPRVVITEKPEIAVSFFNISHEKYNFTLSLSSMSFESQTTSSFEVERTQYRSFELSFVTGSVKKVNRSEIHYSKEMAGIKYATQRAWFDVLNVSTKVAKPIRPSIDGLKFKSLSTPDEKSKVIVTPSDTFQLQLLHSMTDRHQTQGFSSMWMMKKKQEYLEISRETTHMPDEKITKYSIETFKFFTVADETDSNVIQITSAVTSIIQYRPLSMAVKTEFSLSSVTPKIETTLPTITLPTSPTMILRSWFTVTTMTSVAQSASPTKFLFLQAKTQSNIITILSTQYKSPMITYETQSTSSVMNSTIKIDPLTVSSITLISSSVTNKTYITPLSLLLNMTHITCTTSPNITSLIQSTLSIIPKIKILPLSTAYIIQRISSTERLTISSTMIHSTEFISVIIPPTIQPKSPTMTPHITQSMSPTKLPIQWTRPLTKQSKTPQFSFFKVQLTSTTTTLLKQARSQTVALTRQSAQSSPTIPLLISRTISLAIKETSVYFSPQTLQHLIESDTGDQIYDINGQQLLTLQITTGYSDIAITTGIIFQVFDETLKTMSWGKTSNWVTTTTTREVTDGYDTMKSIISLVITITTHKTNVTTSKSTGSYPYSPYSVHRFNKTVSSNLFKEISTVTTKVTKILQIHNATETMPGDFDEFQINMFMATFTVGVLFDGLKMKEFTELFSKESSTFLSLPEGLINTTTPFIVFTSLDRSTIKDMTAVSYHRKQFFISEHLVTVTDARDSLMIITQVPIYDYFLSSSVVTDISLLSLTEITKRERDYITATLSMTQISSEVYTIIYIAKDILVEKGLDNMTNVIVMTFPNTSAKGEYLTQPVIPYGKVDNRTKTVIELRSSNYLEGSLSFPSMTVPIIDKDSVSTPTVQCTVRHTSTEIPSRLTHVQKLSEMLTLKRETPFTTDIDTKSLAVPIKKMTAHFTVFSKIPTERLSEKYKYTTRNETKILASTSTEKSSQITTDFRHILFQDLTQTIQYETTSDDQDFQVDFDETSTRKRYIYLNKTIIEGYIYTGSADSTHMASSYSIDIFHPVTSTLLKYGTILFDLYTTQIMVETTTSIFQRHTVTDYPYTSTKPFKISTIDITSQKISYTYFKDLSKSRDICLWDSKDSSCVEAQLTDLKTTSQQEEYQKMIKEILISKGDSSYEMLTESSSIIVTLDFQIIRKQTKEFMKLFNTVTNPMIEFKSHSDVLLTQSSRGASSDRYIKLIAKGFVTEHVLSDRQTDSQQSFLVTDIQFVVPSQSSIVPIDSTFLSQSIKISIETATAITIIKVPIKTSSLSQSMKVVTEAVISSLFTKRPIKTVISSQSMEKSKQISVKSWKAFMVTEAQISTTNYVTGIIQRIGVPSDKILYDDFSISYFPNITVSARYARMSESPLFRTSFRLWWKKAEKVTDLERMKIKLDYESTMKTKIGMLKSTEIHKDIVFDKMPKIIFRYSLTTPDITDVTIPMKNLSYFEILNATTPEIASISYRHLKAEIKDYQLKSFTLVDVDYQMQNTSLCTFQTDLGKKTVTDMSSPSSLHPKSFTKDVLWMAATPGFRDYMETIIIEFASNVSLIVTTPNATLHGNLTIHSSGKIKALERDITMKAVYLGYKLPARTTVSIKQTLLSSVKTIHLTQDDSTIISKRLIELATNTITYEISKYEQGIQTLSVTNYYKIQGDSVSLIFEKVEITTYESLTTEKIKTIRQETRLTYDDSAHTGIFNELKLLSTSKELSSESKKEMTMESKQFIRKTDDVLLYGYVTKSVKTEPISKDMFLDKRFYEIIKVSTVSHLPTDTKQLVLATDYKIKNETSFDLKLISKMEDKDIEKYVKTDRHLILHTGITTHSLFLLQYRNLTSESIFDSIITKIYPRLTTEAKIIKDLITPSQYSHSMISEKLTAKDVIYRLSETSKIDSSHLDMKYFHINDSSLSLVIPHMTKALSFDKISDVMSSLVILKSTTGTSVTVIPSIAEPKTSKMFAAVFIDSITQDKLLLSIGTLVNYTEKFISKSTIVTDVAETFLKDDIKMSIKYLLPVRASTSPSHTVYLSITESTIIPVHQSRIESTEFFPTSGTLGYISTTINIFPVYSISPVLHVNVTTASLKSDIILTYDSLHTASSFITEKYIAPLTQKTVQTDITTKGSMAQVFQRKTTSTSLKISSLIDMTTRFYITKKPQETMEISKIHIVSSSYPTQRALSYKIISSVASVAKTSTRDGTAVLGKLVKELKLGDVTIAEEYIQFGIPTAQSIKTFVVSKMESKVSDNITEVQDESTTIISSVSAEISHISVSKKHFKLQHFSKQIFQNFSSENRTYSVLFAGLSTTKQHQDTFKINDTTLKKSTIQDGFLQIQIETLSTSFPILAQYSETTSSEMLSKIFPELWSTKIYQPLSNVTVKSIQSADTTMSTDLFHAILETTDIIGHENVSYLDEYNISQTKLLLLKSMETFNTTVPLILKKKTLGMTMVQIMPFQYYSDEMKIIDTTTIQMVLFSSSPDISTLRILSHYYPDKRKVFNITMIQMTPSKYHPYEMISIESGYSKPIVVTAMRSINISKSELVQGKDMLQITKLSVLPTFSKSFIRLTSAKLTTSITTEPPKPFVLGSVISLIINTVIPLTFSESETEMIYNVSRVLTPFNRSISEETTGDEFIDVPSITKFHQEPLSVVTLGDKRVLFHSTAEELSEISTCTSTAEIFSNLSQGSILQTRQITKFLGKKHVTSTSITKLRGERPRYKVYDIQTTLSVTTISAATDLLTVLASSLDTVDILTDYIMGSAKSLIPRLILTEARSRSRSIDITSKSFAIDIINGSMITDITARSWVIDIRTGLLSSGDVAGPTDASVPRIMADKITRSQTMILTPGLVLANLTKLKNTTNLISELKTTDIYSIISSMITGSKDIDIVIKLRGTDYITTPQVTGSMSTDISRVETTRFIHGLQSDITGTITTDIIIPPMVIDILNRSVTDRYSITRMSTFTTNVTLTGLVSSEPITPEETISKVTDDMIIELLTTDTVSVPPRRLVTAKAVTQFTTAGSDVISTITIRSFITQVAVSIRKDMIESVVTDYTLIESGINITEIYSLAVEGVVTDSIFSKELKIKVGLLPEFTATKDRALVLYDGISTRLIAKRDTMSIKVTSFVGSKPFDSGDKTIGNTVSDTIMKSVITGSVPFAHVTRESIAYDDRKILTDFSDVLIRSKDFHEATTESITTEHNISQKVITKGIAVDTKIIESKISHDTTMQSLVFDNITKESTIFYQMMKEVNISKAVTKKSIISDEVTTYIISDNGTMVAVTSDKLTVKSSLLANVTPEFTISHKTTVTSTLIDSITKEFTITDDVRKAFIIFDNLTTFITPDYVSLKHIAFDNITMYYIGSENVTLEYRVSDDGLMTLIGTSDHVKLISKHSNDSTIKSIDSDDVKIISDELTVAPLVFTGRVIETSSSGDGKIGSILFTELSLRPVDSDNATIASVISDEAITGLIIPDHKILRSDYTSKTTLHIHDVKPRTLVSGKVKVKTQVVTKAIHFDAISKQFLVSGDITNRSLISDHRTRYLHRDNTTVQFLVSDDLTTRSLAKDDILTSRFKIIVDEELITKSQIDHDVTSSLLSDHIIWSLVSANITNSLIKVEVTMRSIFGDYVTQKSRVDDDATRFLAEDDNITMRLPLVSDDEKKASVDSVDEHMGSTLLAIATVEFAIPHDATRKDIISTEILSDNETIKEPVSEDVTMTSMFTQDVTAITTFSDYVTMQPTIFNDTIMNSTIYDDVITGSVTSDKTMELMVFEEVTSKHTVFDDITIDFNATMRSTASDDVATIFSLTDDTAIISTVSDDIAIKSKFDVKTTKYIVSRDIRGQSKVSGGVATKFIISGDVTMKSTDHDDDSITKISTFIQIVTMRTIVSFKATRKFPLPHDITKKSTESMTIKFRVSDVRSYTVSDNVTTKFTYSDETKIIKMGLVIFDNMTFRSSSIRAIQFVDSENVTAHTIASDDLTFGSIFSDEIISESVVFSHVTTGYILPEDIADAIGWDSKAGELVTKKDVVTKQTFIDLSTVTFNVSSILTTMGDSVTTFVVLESSITTTIATDDYITISVAINDSFAVATTTDDSITKTVFINGSTIAVIESVNKSASMEDSVPMLVDKDDSVNQSVATDASIAITAITDDRAGLIIREHSKVPSSVEDDDTISTTVQTSVKIIILTTYGIVTRDTVVDDRTLKSLATDPQMTRVSTTDYIKSSVITDKLIIGLITANKTLYVSDATEEVVYKPVVIDVMISRPVTTGMTIYKLIGSDVITYRTILSDVVTHKTIDIKNKTTQSLSTHEVMYQPLTINVTIYRPVIPYTALNKTVGIDDKVDQVLQRIQWINYLSPM